MTNSRTVLCGNIHPAGILDSLPVLNLDRCDGDGNVKIKISDISSRLASNIPDVLLDLLEVASYVYCADQALTRGGDGVVNYGSNWRRDLDFHIPVRKLDVWSSREVLKTLQKTLGFLSDDNYQFHFYAMTDPPPVTQYLDFGEKGGTGFEPEEVMLFSGGLDSLGGAIQEAIVHQRRIALVSHRPAPKIARLQKLLWEDINRASGNKTVHVPVWVTKEASLRHEYTQRSRSFLYASLAVVVSKLFGLNRFRFYENGIISINLPISEQAIGGRATRTTHPQVLDGFSKLFSTLLQENFQVENPFLWKTKTEIVRFIRDSGFGKFISNSVSCAHYWDQTKMQHHCGLCSQCIDRRFATLAAGCLEGEDPPESYKVDLLIGPREPGIDLTMIESYVKTAKEIHKMNDMNFMKKFPEIHRLLPYCGELTIDQAASKVYDLFSRHASQVCSVLKESFPKYAGAIQEGKLPANCLMTMEIHPKYRTVTKETSDAPLLILDEYPERKTKHHVARLFGDRHLKQLDKGVGSRDFFFLYQLFQSQERRSQDGVSYTVTSEEAFVRCLLDWANSGFIGLKGKDKAKPKDRLSKMWTAFEKHLHAEALLEGLFSRVHIAHMRYYGIRLHPQELQIRIKELAYIFRKD